MRLLFCRRWRVSFSTNFRCIVLRLNKANPAVHSQTADNDPLQVEESLCYCDQSIIVNL